jgi:hypothetical protein
VKTPCGVAITEYPNVALSAGIGFFKSNPNFRNGTAENGESGCADAFLRLHPKERPEPACSQVDCLVP